jgi:hypothetical protein
MFTIGNWTWQGGSINDIIIILALIGGIGYWVAIGWCLIGLAKCAVPKRDKEE